MGLLIKSILLSSALYVSTCSSHQSSSQKRKKVEQKDIQWRIITIMLTFHMNFNCLRNFRCFVVRTSKQKRNPMIGEMWVEFSVFAWVSFSYLFFMHLSPLVLWESMRQNEHWKCYYYFGCIVWLSSREVTFITYRWNFFKRAPTNTKVSTNAIICAQYQTTLQTVQYINVYIFSNNFPISRRTQIK